MTTIKPFAAYCPAPQYAAAVAALPYDVMNRAEATAMGNNNPQSFLHVSRAEIDLPANVSDYDPQVYQQARSAFEQMIEQGILHADTAPTLYIYAQTMNGRRQTGIVALTSTADYDADVIKKHEFTRHVKEQDRINHMSATRLHSEPVFMAYRRVAAIDALVNEASATEQTPLYDFVATDGIRHQAWRIAEPQVVAQLVGLFAQHVPAIYIADGHHRAASSAKVAAALAQQNPHHTGNEAYNYFLSVLFADHQLAIMDYNRLISDLNGYTPNELLAALSPHFGIQAIPQAQHPPAPHTFSVYLSKQWYLLIALPHTYHDQHPIDSLDVSIITQYMLPMLSITDQRTDKRIDFVGGIRGLAELERRVDSGEMAMAVALYPVSIAQLLTVADSGQVMPPKSTWFEPKLRSGLFIHQF